jgi:hypothetical protein
LQPREFFFILSIADLSSSRNAFLLSIDKKFQGSLLYLTWHLKSTA